MCRPNDPSVADFDDTPVESICVESNDRFVLHPIRHPALWAMTKAHQSCFWTAEEVDMTGDREDMKTLSAKERAFILKILAFFAGSDGIVMENAVSQFSKEIQLSEARAFYAVQTHMEMIHSETYSLLLQAYEPRPERLAHLFRAIDTIPSVKAKADWALSWITNDKPLALRLVAFACVEGIMFSSSFCAIYWLTRDGKFGGLGQSNELISRDERLHTEFACKLYELMDAPLDEKTVHAVVRHAVDVEQAFVRDALPEALLGMNAETMSTYVECVADRLVVGLRHPKLAAPYAPVYGATNPFTWMDKLGVKSKTNFFEQRVNDYKLASISTGETLEALDDF